MNTMKDIEEGEIELLAPGGETAENPENENDDFLDKDEMDREEELKEGSKENLLAEVEEKDNEDIDEDIKNLPRNTPEFEGESIEDLSPKKNP